MKREVYPPTLPPLDWPPQGDELPEDSDKCQCPHCGSTKTRRRSGRKVHTSKPMSGGQVQYRICLNPDCLRTFKAVFTWSYDPEPGAY
jgi:hypothetical protein